MKLRKVMATVLAAAVATATFAISAAAEDYSADVALYVQNNADWSTASSETVTVNADGTYVLSLDGLSVATSALTVIYIKDAAVYAETAKTSNLPESTVITTDALTINGTEMALTEGYNTALTDGVFDIAYANIWADTYVDLTGIDTIESVSVEFTVSGVSADAVEETEATDEEVTDEAVENETADEEVADEAEEATDEEVVDEAVADEAEEAVNEKVVEEIEEEAEDTAMDLISQTAPVSTEDKASPDTGVEGVAAVAGLAIVAAGAVIIAKNRK